MMAGFFPPKMKRKDLGDVYDDFSEFSLSSPARKIRRLDAELPPIIEEEDPVPLSVEQQVPQVQTVREVPEVESKMVDFEPTLPFNEERALVLYKPVNNQVVWSPTSPNVSFSMNSDVIDSLKSQAFWQGNPKVKQAVGNNSLAVIPWVPSQVPSSPGSESKVVHVEGVMDADNGEEEEVGGSSSSMEVEEDREGGGISTGGGEGLHTWQQQHCLIPQPSRYASTPIVWSKR